MTDETPPQRAPEPRWFDRAFGPFYEDLYARRDADAAAREVRFAVARLRLAPGQRVLDLACGPGHHVARLRALGLDAVGLDRSGALVRRCRDAGPAVRGDMRRLPLAGPFDAVLSFFTTLGYFATDEENLRPLAEIARVLAPGGRFLLDHLNPEGVRRRLVPVSERTAGGRRVRERRWIEEGPAPRVCKRVEAEGLEPYTECVRLFDRRALEALCAAAGLSVDAAFGGFDGAPPSPDAPRLVLTGRA